ncbi:hypothetical protein P5673_020710 [Acropora cervicornis]|uniref:Uncharacterized protein n=1 Tax=Acropora cervicornis TaxID=6130 RepID=A0AAD9V0X6_ACRCE|nr:hypothetical protein P5673_020710 [Acropora cervicornis]
MTSFGDTKLRSLGDYFASNLSRGADPMWQGWKRIWNSYRAKYVTCKNAKLTPFLHVVFLSIALNYAIDYQHLKGNVKGVFNAQGDRYVHGLKAKGSDLGT